MPDDRRDRALEESLRAALERASEESAAGEPGKSAGREAEERALVAFRAARDAGLHSSLPTRRRDDWTPPAERRHPGRSLRTAVAALLASVTLGGVAVATGALPGRLLETPAPAPEPTSDSVAPRATPAAPETGTERPAPSDVGTPLRPVPPVRYPPAPAETREGPCRDAGPDPEEKREKQGEKKNKAEKGEAGRDEAEQGGGGQGREPGDAAPCRREPPPGPAAGPDGGPGGRGRTDSGLSTGSDGQGRGVGGGR